MSVTKLASAVSSASIQVQITKNLRELQNGFTDDDLRIVEENFQPFWETTEPQMFGEDLHRNLQFEGFEIVPLDLFEIYQEDRSGGQNLRSNEIKQSITQNGWKMKYIFPAVFFRAAVSPHIITGNTRIKIAKDLGMKNMIVARYGTKGNPSAAVLQEALIESGQSFNTHHDPNSPPSQFDVKRGLTKLIRLYESSNGEAGVDVNDSDAMRATVDRMCGKGVFSDKVRTRIVQEIQNQYTDVDIVIPWGESKDSKFRISVYMKDYNMINNNKVIYVPVASNSSAKAMRRANKLAFENPNKEIRLVIHTSVLEGFDYEEVYNNRLRKFVAEFELYRVQDSRGNPEWLECHRNQIKVYAALPALSSCHNLNEPVLFNMRDMVAFQKENNTEGEAFNIDLEFDDE